MHLAALSASSRGGGDVKPIKLTMQAFGPYAQRLKLILPL
jgi:hypothetical protein